MAQENNLKKIEKKLKSRNFDLEIKNELFRLLANGNNIQGLLFHYFSNTNTIDEAFEKRLASESPKEFIKAVQTNQYFLRENRIDFLLNLDLPAEFQPHQIVWLELQQEELKRWKAVEYCLKRLTGISLSKVLIYLVLWIENKRFYSNDKKTVFRLSGVYNSFIELYFSTHPNLIKESIDSLDFFKVYIRFLTESKKNPLDNVLSAMDKWLRFNDSVLAEYCFDQSVQVKLQNGVAHLFRNKSSVYQWKLDGVRYELNRWNYISWFLEVADVMENNGDLIIPKGRLLYDKHVNRELFAKQLAIQDIITSIGIETIVINGRKQQCLDLFLPVLITSTNRRYRYESAFQNATEIYKDWREALKEILKDSEKIDIVNNPYFLELSEEYEKQIETFIGESKHEIKEYGLSIFSYTPGQKKIDRFMLNYDVWKQPFLKFGEMLFCPMIFLADNDWIFTFPQIGMRSLANSENKGEQERSTKRMEKYLKDVFTSKGFKVKTFNPEEDLDIIGDVDLVVEDENSSILIQLKRTYFRLSLRDQYLESMSADKKAIQQLNDAEKFFSKSNILYKLKPNCIKWIVTTSFEQIGREFKGCRKINYFDLLSSLRIFDIKSLDALIDYFESDHPISCYQELYESNTESNVETRLFLDEIGFPIREEDVNSSSAPIYFPN